eukprot:GFUD01081284.1.p1 GENE.GFUD01081284.1~~GFUD01081284.1.p1  ORF type:complete len:347 (+),score=84.45 GFUD01081284.1:63-1103(+)
MDFKNNRYVKLSGVPWGAKPNDIEEFLIDCNIVGDPVIVRYKSGRATGDAVARLVGKSDLEKALKCHQKYLGKRYIKVEETDGDTFEKHFSESVAFNKEPFKLPSLDVRCYTQADEAKKQEVFRQADSNPKERVRYNEEEKMQEAGKLPDMNDRPKYTEVKIHGNAFVKLSGLAWTANEKDVRKFLNDCKVHEVVITNNDKGKPSGNAFVQLDSKGDVMKARAHNKEHLCKRFVNVEEVEKQQFIRETERDRKDYSSFHVKMKNLPFSATEPEIKALFKDLAIEEVIMMRNKDYKPSGKAMVEFKSEDDQAKALLCDNKPMGSRSVEVNKVEKYDVKTIETQHNFH